MSASVSDLRPALNARRRAMGLGPIADWGPVEWRAPAIGYALARAAAVYVWPWRRIGTLAGSAGQGPAPLLRVRFSDGDGWFPVADVHPIPFCLRFKPVGEVEEYLRAEERAAETFAIAAPATLPAPPSGDAA